MELLVPIVVIIAGAIIIERVYGAGAVPPTLLRTVGVVAAMALFAAAVAVAIGGIGQ
jgi:hypothetical protein